MRVVLDTNVLVSGLLSSQCPPAWTVEAVLAGEPLNPEAHNQVLAPLHGNRHQVQEYRKER